MRLCMHVRMCMSCVCVRVHVRVCDIRGHRGARTDLKEQLEEPVMRHHAVKAEKLLQAPQSSANADSPTVRRCCLVVCVVWLFARHAALTAAPCTRVSSAHPQPQRLRRHTCLPLMHRIAHQLLRDARVRAADSRQNAFRRKHCPHIRPKAIRSLCQPPPTCAAVRTGAAHHGPPVRDTVPCGIRRVTPSCAGSVLLCVVIARSNAAAAPRCIVDSRHCCGPTCHTFPKLRPLSSHA
jgi:hypothetical protein